MRPSSATLLLGILVVGAACQRAERAPTRPDPLPNAAAFIPSAPAPQPTPTPTPGAEPEEEPYPATPGGAGVDPSGCGAPVPPPVTRVNVKLHQRLADRMLLDSTPLVGPDPAYCRLIGFTDGRSYCPVRAEGDPERAACEATRVGRADDTGRFGPTWTAAGRPCRGSEAGASCLNHPENQFQVFAYGAGAFRACTASGVCGEIVLP